MKQKKKKQDRFFPLSFRAAKEAKKAKQAAKKPAAPAAKVSSWHMNLCFMYLY